MQRLLPILTRHSSKSLKETCLLTNRTTFLLLRHMFPNFYKQCVLYCRICSNNPHLSLKSLCSFTEFRFYYIRKKFVEIICLHNINKIINVYSSAVQGRYPLVFCCVLVFSLFVWFANILPDSIASRWLKEVANKYGI